jgi:hypothetical protein
VVPAQAGIPAGVVALSGVEGLPQVSHS